MRRMLFAGPGAVLVLVVGSAWAGDESNPGPLLPTGKPVRADSPADIPAAAGWTSVKDYGAVGDGKTDDTEALRRAVADLCGSQFAHKTLFFPKGTYIVSDSVLWPLAQYFTVRGAGAQGTAIRLKDNAAGFADPGNPKPVMAVAWGHKANNTMFNCYVRDIAFDVGAGNPGAIGLDFASSNVGAVRDVAIRSSDPGKAGRSGLSMLAGWPGPLLVKNITVEGFDIGIKIAQAQYSVTFENVSVADQRQVGVQTDANSIFIRHLKSRQRGPVPAVSMGGEALVVLDQADVSCAAAEAGGQAAVTGDGALYARDLKAGGYGKAIRNRGKDAASPVAEFATSAASLSDAPAASLGLPVLETPDYENRDVRQWALAKTFNPESLHEAMQSGKPVVCFPENAKAPFRNPENKPEKGPIQNRYQIKRTVVIPSSVRWFNAQHQQISIEGGRIPVAFRIEGKRSDPPLIIEDVFTWYQQYGSADVQFEHASGRTLVLKDCGGDYKALPGAGNVFIENCVMNASFVPGQKVWARQFNCEAIHGARADSGLVVNDGADLWVLGMKTEGTWTVVRSVNGARTELLGGFFYPVFGSPGPETPLFSVDNSALSAVYKTFIQNYHTHARQVLGDETKTMGPQQGLLIRVGKSPAVK
jgi:hypothetical protein